jgi:hypothetical protein
MLPDLKDPLWGVVSEREIFVRGLKEFDWDEFIWGLSFGEKRFELLHLLLADLLAKDLLHVLKSDALEKIDVSESELDGHLLFFGEAFDFGFLDKMSEKKVMAKLTSDKASDGSSKRTDGWVSLEKLLESVVELNIVHKDVVQDLLG